MFILYVKKITKKNIKEALQFMKENVANIHTYECLDIFAYQIKKDA